MDKGIQPVTLRGTHVRLEPASTDHAEAMCKAAHDRPFTLFSRHIDSDTVEGCREQLQFLIDHPTTLPFTLFDARTDELIGGTTYCDIRPAHRGVEIGWTWITKERRGSVVNPEMKYLLLRHAFETDLFESGPAIRVVLKTHHENLRSQAAISKLGAKHEANLRNHVIMPDGSYRHSVVYSILEDEWDKVKDVLKNRLGEI